MAESLPAHQIEKSEADLFLLLVSRHLLFFYDNGHNQLYGVTQGVLQSYMYI